MTKYAKLYNREKTGSSTMVLGKLGITCKRMNLEHSLILHAKIKSKWIKDLNVRPDTTRLL